MTTLARLSFWVSPTAEGFGSHAEEDSAARMEAFGEAYEGQLGPLLKKHGLIEAAAEARPGVPGSFSRPRRC